MARRAESQPKQRITRAGLSVLILATLGLPLVAERSLPTPTQPPQQIDFGEIARAHETASFVAIRRRTVLDFAPGDNSPDAKRHVQDLRGTEDADGRSQPGARGSGDPLTQKRSGSVSDDGSSGLMPGGQVLEAFGLNSPTVGVSTLERLAVRGADFDAQLIGLSPVGFDNDPGASPRVALRVADEGTWVSPNSAQRQRFESQEAFLVQHSDFGIEDPTAAGLNYRLLVLGLGVRRLITDPEQALVPGAVLSSTTIEGAVPRDRSHVERTVVRIAILPQRIGRPSWIVELDEETLVPLFTVALDAAGIPLSVVETVAFEPRPISQPFTDTWIDWWAPEQQIRTHAAEQDALAALPDGQWALPRDEAIPGGYQLLEIQSSTKRMSFETSLIATYGDGVEEIFVVSTKSPDIPLTEVLTGSEGAVFTAFTEETILTYEDRDIAQFLFLADPETTVAVVGRSGHSELSGLASHLFRSFRSTN